MRRRTRDTPVRWCLTPYGQRIVAGNLGLVGRFVKAYRDSGLSPDERESAAYLGLCHAAALYRPDKGFAFSTYACYWIRSLILREIAANYMIHIPRYHVEAPGRRRYSGEAEGVRCVWRLDPVGLTMRSVPARRDAEPGPETLRLYRAIRGLTRRHRLVIRLRLRKVRLQRIGAYLGVTRERARQIEEEARQELRTILEVSP